MFLLEQILLVQRHHFQVGGIGRTCEPPPAGGGFPELTGCFLGRHKAGIDLNHLTVQVGRFLDVLKWKGKNGGGK